MNKNYDSQANCSTIIVGKDASATGRVIMAHNEDDLGCVVQSHLVPRMKHEKGETITFPDGTAVIPQVEETWAFYWDEFRALHGEPFADAFYNEWGVSVTSNSGIGSKVPEDGSVTGGLGYGLRRLIAERATSARHGVEIACALLEEFGYRSTRIYEICDKEEAWVLQVATGHNFVAQRVGDDEIFFIPNWFTVHRVDFSDTEHKKFYWSKNLIQYALDHGYYTPAKAGDYSDFDFADVYQAQKAYIPFNSLRSDLGWPLLVGHEVPHRTFSLKAEKKYTVEDMKPVLRSHQHDAIEKDGTPHLFGERCGVCWATTVVSMIMEFGPRPELTCIHQAFRRPCMSPYTPWYMGLDRLPKGYEWIGPKASLVSHFEVDEREVEYDGNLAYWAFHLLQNMTELDYTFCAPIVQERLARLEAQWALEKPAVDAAAAQLLETDPAAGRAFLTDYTAAQAQKAWDWAQQMILELADRKNRPNEEKFTI